MFTQREEIDIDFRVSGLPHAVVKQAENFSVRELVKKVESHPHRRALQADLLPTENVLEVFTSQNYRMPFSFTLYRQTRTRKRSK